MKTIDKLEAINNRIDELKTSIKEATSVDEAQNYITEFEQLTEQKNNLEDDIKEVVTMNNYLETPQAMMDFAEAFKNARNTEDAHTTWKKKLQENGITVVDKDSALPKKLEQEIQTVLTRSNPVFPLFKLTNVGAMLITREFTSNDEAKVHVPGTTKDVQNATLTLSAIKPKMIYKRQAFDELDKRTFENFAEVYELVVQELSQRIIDKIVDLALVEGTAVGGDDSRTENGFISITNEKDTNKVKHVDGTTDLVAALEDAVDLIDAPGRKFLVITLAQKRAILNALRTKFPQAVYRNNNDELAAEFGLDGVIIYRGSKQIKPTVIAEGAYAVDMQPLTRVEQFKLETNTNDILVETPATGRPVAFGGIAVVDLA